MISIVCFSGFPVNLDDDDDMGDDFFQGNVFTGLSTFGCICCHKPHAGNHILTVHCCYRGGLAGG